ncbi:uncharacterized protein [Physcomitrium patens]|uniref:OVATE domain-containing protein n=1 Tax=Physcomitrium patens TaxID=3218 RepID=A0A2K1IRQ8_PHYPA|nr:uncharacterized protein LOC112274114 [Physcomitrium patens]XP_024359054.1 uncharacterized protein LOC112274114 [Physcomitrium patens]XP_024359055.1 uncharacterized protein LOC112274114 [Physcomitrium patens]XP_024359056.1 uncharacterized protein LOC112274114 [Physcomitrium patens]XP_024359057.1 uncharacterized protein LOC112274114 [Physcomitrium patens]XP_024359058.1 uncharacterized protein LOC112274114 [Physcomitrium patens]XP_024359059.1 uncharacterized protein LOC112274114 [Physcomitriu|eukprot:XP_024359053.1 uncharacterized protein LOC112274114 [Physcomitrella patens]
MAEIEKPKKKLLSRGSPQAWFIRFLRSVRRNPHRRLRDHEHAHSPEPVNTRNSKKVVENIYKNQENAFSRIESSPNFNVLLEKGRASSASPKPEDSLLRAFSKSKSYVHPDEADETDEASSRSGTSHGKSKSSVFSSLGYLCSAAGEESFSKRSSRSEQVSSSSRSRSESRSPWFFPGCGSFSSRNRRTRYGSMDNSKKAGLLQLDVNTEEVCTEATKAEEVASRRCQKGESWVGDDTRTWSMDLSIYGEVVKCLVNDVKSSPTANRKSATLGELFSEPETDEAPMIPPRSEDEFDDPYPAFPWSSSMSSFGSSREFWRTEKKNRNATESSTALVPYSGEFGSVDIGNISDSQSLLRAKVFGAEMYRKQCQLEKKREEETKRLLLSLDLALDQYNHERITEDDDFKVQSPNFELYNSPVFESFLESSTKAWGTDPLPLRIEGGLKDLKTPESIRELHCITIPSPDIMGNQQELMLDEEGVRDTTLCGDAPSAAGKARNSTKCSVDTSTQAKRSPSTSICEDRIHHPQGEDNAVLNFARLQIDELSTRKRRFSKPRRAHKQRRFKQTAFGAESSVSPRPPRPVGNVVKESVAVVVESSYDPYADFRESMIDMIVDQNIQQTSDLEELLQCYLALNEPEYHPVIVDVFSDVWHELFEDNST